MSEMPKSTALKNARERFEMLERRFERLDILTCDVGQACTLAADLYGTLKEVLDETDFRLPYKVTVGAGASYGEGVHFDTLYLALRRFLVHREQFGDKAAPERVAGPFYLRDTRIEPYTPGPVGRLPRPDNGIRVTHQPSGITVECDEHRNQHKNRAEALRILGAILNGLEGVG